MKILLAEDHDNLREIIEDYLVVHGYVVESFDNGEDAYYSFLTESYDLVLLDVMMPDMSGFEVSQQLKANPETSEMVLHYVKRYVKKKKYQFFLLRLRYKKLIS